jgi:hypothetical protein
MQVHHEARVLALGHHIDLCIACVGFSLIWNGAVVGLASQG